MNEARPFVDIILPIRNEVDHIEACLESVLLQDYPHDRMRILIADGQSTDGTRDIVRRLVEAHPGRDVLLVDNPGRIVPTGFNRALREGRGTVVVRVDGHCVIEPDYVSRCVESLVTNEADNVGGLQRTRGRGLIGSAIARAMTSPFGVGNARFRYSDTPGPADTVFLGAWRRDVFDCIGGFDEELVRNQDDEFNFRLVQAGGTIWLDPEIRSTYFSRTGFRALWKQYFAYGLYKVRVAQKRGGLASWRHGVPALFVLGLTASAIVSLVSSDPSWVGVPLLAYAVASAIASVRAARGRWRLLPLLPPAFFTLHFAYGLGFLVGLWRWRGGWGERTVAPPLPAPARDRSLT